MSKERLEFNVKKEDISSLQDVDRTKDIIRYNLFPTHEEINEILETDPHFHEYLLSTRRLKAIYFATPMTILEQSVAEELQLTFGDEISQSQIDLWNSQKRRLMYMFYEWSIRYCESRDYNNDFQDTLLAETERFIDNTWNGSISSLYRYFSSLPHYISLFLNKKPEYALEDEWMKISDTLRPTEDLALENHSNPSLFYDDLPEKIVSLGYMIRKNYPDNSVFENIPLVDVPKVIDSLQSRFNKYITLGVLGYINLIDKPLDVLDTGSRSLSHKKIFRNKAYDRVTKELLRIIDKKEYATSQATFQTLLADMQTNSIPVFFDRHNFLFQMNSFRQLLLERAEEIDTKKVEALPAFHRYVMELLLLHVDHTVLYTSHDIAAITKKDFEYIKKIEKKLYQYFFETGSIQRSLSKKEKIDKAGTRRTMFRNRYLEELEKVAEQFNYTEFSKRKFNALSTSNATYVSHHFGSWNKALQALREHLESKNISLAVRKTVRNQTHSTKDLLLEMDRIYTFFKRQIGRVEWDKAEPSVNGRTLERRFTSWDKAWEAFFEYKNSH